MAIAFDAAMGAAGSSVSSVTTPAWTISGDNRCMVGAMMWQDFYASNYDFHAMRWGGPDGTDFTQLGTKFTHATYAMGLATAQLIAPTAMTATLYGGVFNVESPVVSYLFVGAANYTGVNQVAPLGTPVNVADYSNTPSISVTINPGEWALGWLITDDYTITPGGSQNQRWEVENFPSYSASGDDRTGSGSVDLSWTTLSYNAYLARAVALKPDVHFHLTAESGSYAITGQIADLVRGQSYLLTAESGSYSIGGQEAALSWHGITPIAFDAAGSAFGTSVSSVTTPAWTISGNNRCMVGALMWQDPEAANYYVDLLRWGGPNGANFYQFGSTVIHPSGNLAFDTDHLIAPTVGTATLYGQVSGVVEYLFVGAVNYTGVNQGTPLGTPVTTVSDSSTPSISVSINPGEWALGWIIAISDIVSPAGSQNQRWKVEDTVSVSGDDRTDSGSVTFSWGLSGALPPSIARAVALKPAGFLTAESGSYVVIGQEADLSWQRSYLLTAGSGAYTSIGQVADLSWQINPRDYLLTAGSGSYAVIGQVADLLWQINPQEYLLTAGSGSYTVIGQVADLSWQRIYRDYLLTAGGGLYTVTGQVVDLLWQEIYPSYLLNAEPGVYMTQGKAVRFAYSAFYVLRVLRRQPLN